MTGDAQIVPGEVIATFRDGKGREHVRAHGLAVSEDLGAPGRGIPAVVSTAGRPVNEVIAELKADPDVLSVEPNYLVQLVDDGSVAGAMAVNDPKSSTQYSLDQMRVRNAWNRSTGGSNLIAVLDTGIQFSHPDLEGRTVRGYDFVNDDTRAADDNGHGTWVAGIIAANANDGYGMAGISWSDNILPVKIMSREGTGTTSDLIAGIRYAADKGADIINMSVGGFPYSQVMQDTVNYAFAKGAVLVGAAGNNRREERFYPASFDNVISVSATQPDDEFSNWSSYGPAVDVSAPGSSVLVTNCYTCTYADHDTWGTHMLISGTSFATPNVSGVLALIRARFPAASAQQVVNRLFSTVDDLGYPGWDNRYGRGRVNALRALGATVAQPGISRGDAMESNNGLGSAVKIPLGTTTSPSIHPAGDIDVFAVDVPRAGSLVVRVTGIVDSRAWPYHQSGIPIDPIVELFTSGGSLLKRVDNEWESGTERATVSVGGRVRILVRITNFYPNGNRGSYTITPKFVDDVAPVGAIQVPSAGAADVTQWVVPVATFNEAVRGVSSKTVRLRDMETRQVVPASVSYDSTSREVRLKPAARLLGNHPYRFEVTSGITDGAGNSLAATRARFSTSHYAFRDIQGTPYAAEIQWIADRHIIPGCGSERFCPTARASRTATAVALDRALNLPPTGSDYFTDDNGSGHEGAINRVAEARLMSSCATGMFCPRDGVRRKTMAGILVRAFDLPAVEGDFFADDEGRPYEDAVNRVAAAGLMTGCGSTSFCPDGFVLRQELAGIFYRALAD